MKEKYFTPENIDYKSGQIKNQLQKICGRSSLDFSKENSALLVLDMQDFFCNKHSHAYIPSCDAVILKINRLIACFEQAKQPIIFTKHINTKHNAKMMGQWWRDILEENHIYSGIIKDFDLKSHIVLEKTQYDAFYKTSLESVLKEFKANSLVITGVMTHLCCETTARAAFVRGFNPFMPIDATATYNEKFHVNTMENFAHGFSAPVLTEEIPGLFHE